MSKKYVLLGANNDNSEITVKEFASLRSARKAMRLDYENCLSNCEDGYDEDISGINDDDAEILSGSLRIWWQIKAVDEPEKAKKGKKVDRLTIKTSAGTMCASVEDGGDTVSLGIEPKDDGFGLYAFVTCYTDKNAPDMLDVFFYMDPTDDAYTTLVSVDSGRYAKVTDGSGSAAGDYIELETSAGTVYVYANDDVPGFSLRFMPVGSNVISELVYCEVDPKSPDIVTVYGYTKPAEDYYTVRGNIDLNLVGDDVCRW